MLSYIIYSTATLSQGPMRGGDRSSVLWGCSNRHHSLHGTPCGIPCFPCRYQDVYGAWQAPQGGVAVKRTLTITTSVIAPSPVPPLLFSNTIPSCTPLLKLAV